MIYFVRCSATGLVKIGYAANPWLRLSKMQSDNAGTLDIIALEEGDISREQALHHRFASERVRGEWFRFSPELQVHVQRLPKVVRPVRRKQLGGVLGKWLAENSLTSMEFATQLGLVPSTISRICSGERRPGWALMRRIQLATGGAVQPNDWFDSQDEEAA